MKHYSVGEMLNMASVCCRQSKPFDVYRLGDSMTSFALYDTPVMPRKQFYSYYGKWICERGYGELLDHGTMLAMRDHVLSCVRGASVLGVNEQGDHWCKASPDHARSLYDKMVEYYSLDVNTCPTALCRTIHHYQEFWNLLASNRYVVISKSSYVDKWNNYCIRHHPDVVNNMVAQIGQETEAEIANTVKTLSETDYSVAIICAGPYKGHIIRQVKKQNAVALDVGQVLDRAESLTVTVCNKHFGLRMQ